MKIKLTILSLLIAIGVSAQDSNFPKEIYRQYELKVSSYKNNDSLYVEVTNTLKTPLRFLFKTSEEELNKNYPFKDTISFNPLEKKIIAYKLPQKEDLNYSYSSFLGNPNQQVQKNQITFPFPKGKKYKIIQGYNGTFSHNEENNKYAIDFSLKVNDTICSADDGIVVGVIKDYTYGGSTKIWKDNDRSNFITIYHPHSGIYTQYVHLVHQGSLVKVGDEVKKGQPIGLSGMTGFTNISHLHFNVLIPKKGGTFVSIPITFENGIKGEDLKIGKKIKH